MVAVTSSGVGRHSNDRLMRILCLPASHPWSIRSHSKSGLALESCRSSNEGRNSLSTTPFRCSQTDGCGKARSEGIFQIVRERAAESREGREGNSEGGLVLTPREHAVGEESNDKCGNNQGAGMSSFLGLLNTKTDNRDYYCRPKSARDCHSITSITFRLRPKVRQGYTGVRWLY
jgi:hypothetical protein